MDHLEQGFCIAKTDQWTNIFCCGTIDTLLPGRAHPGPELSVPHLVPVTHERGLNMGTLYKRGRVFWLKYNDLNGQPIRESSRSDKKNVAQRLLYKRLGEIAEGRMPGVYFDRTTYDQLAEALVKDYRINKQDVQTVQKRRLHLDKAFNGLRAPQITTALIRRYVAGRLDSGAARATVNRELAALKRMFKLGTQQTPPIVDKVPYIPMLKEKNIRKGYLEHDQFMALLAAMPGYLKGFAHFAYITGWRKGEIANLTWSHIDRVNWIVRLDPGETKNEDGRTVYANENLREVLKGQWKARRELKQPLPWVFTNRWGTGQSKHFYKAWKKALKDANLDEGIHFHDLRRSAVRNMVRAGIPERVAMQLSGHLTRTVFDRYNIVSPGDLENAAIKQQQYMAEQEQACVRPLKIMANG